jgi:hypothetical protein
MRKIQDVTIRLVCLGRLFADYRGAVMISERFLNDFVQLLSKDDVTREMKVVMRPYINMLLKEIYPYLYVSLVFVCISFLLTLSIFVLLLKKSPRSN